jgi:hypothetical protein
MGGQPRKVLAMPQLSHDQEASVTEDLLQMLCGWWRGRPTMELMDAIPSTIEEDLRLDEIERLLRESGQVFERRYRARGQDGDPIFLSYWQLKDWAAYPQEEAEDEDVWYSDSSYADDNWEGDWFDPSEQ